MLKAKLTKRTVDSSAVRSTDYIVWDTELPGFGLRVRPSGTKSYIAMYRSGHGRAGLLRKLTIAKTGDHLTPEQARRRAKELLGAAAQGNDPAADRAKARQDITVSELCDIYLAEGCDLKKESTITTDRGRIERHIKPLIGRKRISELTSTDIERFLSDVAVGKSKADIRTRPRGRAIVEGGKGTATRTIGLLGGIFSFAVRRGLRVDNPAHGVKRYSDRKSERFLSAAELAELGATLRRFETKGANPSAVAIIRLLAFTGARKSEITGLQWREVDFDRQCLRLLDSKTGAKVIPLGTPALGVLASLQKLSEKWVFPAAAGSSRFQGLEKVWHRVREAANLHNLRLHDLRHSYASMGLAGGDALPVIGALLGHSDVKTTARYAHLADDPLKAAASRIASSIATAMNEAPASNLRPKSGR